MSFKGLSSSSASHKLCSCERGWGQWWANDQSFLSMAVKVALQWGGRGWPYYLCPLALQWRHYRHFVSCYNPFLLEIPTVLSGLLLGQKWMLPPVLSSLDPKNSSLRINAETYSLALSYLSEYIAFCCPHIPRKSEFWASTGLRGSLSTWFKHLEQCCTKQKGREVLCPK